MSGQFKGTPGPWEIRMDATMSAAWPVIYFVDEDGLEIDICDLPTTFLGKDGKPAPVFFDEDRSGYERNADADRIDADARLFAASKDLLEALQRMHDLFAPLHTIDESIDGAVVHTNGGAAIEATRAALSKALGEQS